MTLREGGAESTGRNYHSECNSLEKLTLVKKKRQKKKPSEAPSSVFTSQERKQHFSFYFIIFAEDVAFHL